MEVISVSRMVSARVPDAVYESACAKLKEIGSSPSELINSAFDFVLKSGTLPNETRDKRRPQRLNKKQAMRLKQVFADCMLGVNPVDDIEDDKRIAHEARLEKYEALA